MVIFKEDVRHEVLIKIQFGSLSITLFIALSTQFFGFQIFVFDTYVLVFRLIAE